jgi:hypothetical protein
VSELQSVFGKLPEPFIADKKLWRTLKPRMIVNWALLSSA